MKTALTTPRAVVAATMLIAGMGSGALAQTSVRPLDGSGSRESFDYGPPSIPNPPRAQAQRGYGFNAPALRNPSYSIPIPTAPHVTQRYRLPMPVLQRPAHDYRFPMPTLQQPALNFNQLPPGQRQEAPTPDHHLQGPTLWRRFQF
ncbi:hypothetical protein [Methylocystis heyeri]|uniref:Uncharacterized protein n=1 Tax=Methylocystis heyeri TaxID=391905 RepID=A0A6B8KFT7_9HYPH|nr:hypothetical protein [Methylocystis heyeri]QGM45861.1 hypothetical protein H2LOC_009180 [Methylocystis heyeri]